MGKSGNPAKRAQQERPKRRGGRAMLDVDVDLDRGMVLFFVDGEPMGLHPDTADTLALSLANASKHVREHDG